MSNEEKNGAGFDQLGQQQQAEKELSEPGTIDAQRKQSNIYAQEPDVEKGGSEKEALDVEEKLEEHSVERYEENHEKELCPLSWGASLKQASVIWVKVLTKTSPSFYAALVFLWVYYIPTIVLSPDLLSAVKGILYQHVRDLIWSLTLWSSIGLTAVEVFSFQYSRNSIFYALFPGFVMDNILNSVLKLNKVYSNIQNVNQIFSLGVGFTFIYKSKKPENMTDDQEEYYKLTKDGSVSALLKGLGAYFILAVFFFRNIFIVYLKSPFLIKLVFRFFVFPICFSLSKWIQMRLVVELPESRISQRLIVNKMCNHYIQFLGRILISNLSTSSALSYGFVLVNFAAALIEVFSTISFEYRTKLAFKVKKVISALYVKIKSSLNRSKVAPNDPNENVSHESPVGDSAESIQQSRNEEEEYVQEARSFRAKHIYDDIVSEIYSIIFAPLLIYFIHRLVKNSSFQPIPSFEECLYQIGVQLVFEILSDITTLTIEVRRGLIKRADIENWKPINQVILFIWTNFCIFSMNWAIIYYS